jgi:ParB-like chromosome segregation protein Spo0J
MKHKANSRVKISELKTNLFVRSQLDTDHAMYLAELIENGVTLPPIKVSEELMVVDGRHRIEAHELAKHKEIEVAIWHYDNDEELISDAYRANTGGPKPPTPQDTEHTIMLLLDRKESMKRIAELLGLPAGLTRKYATEVKSRMTRAKLQRAASAVTDGGLTVAKAAEQHEVDPDKLKEVLSGHRRKHKNGVQDLHRAFTKNYKSIGQKNAAAVRSLLEKFQDGDVTAKQVRDIIAHLKNLQKQSARSIHDWEKRFEALANPQKVVRS